MAIPNIVLGIYSAKAMDFPEAGALCTLDKESMLEVFHRLRGESVAVLGLDVLRFDSLGRARLDQDELWYLDMDFPPRFSEAEWSALCSRSLDEARRHVESTPTSRDNAPRFIAQFENLAEYEADRARPPKRARLRES